MTKDTEFTTLQSQSQADELLRQACWFGDGTLTDLRVCWHPRAECQLQLWGISPEGQGISLQLEMQSLKQFHWYSKWSGSVECGEVALLQEDGKWCIAVAGSHDDFASIKDVTTETTSFFVIGGGIRYKFQPLTLSSG